MPDTALTPRQELIQTPMQTSDLVDLLLPSLEQQEAVSELLESLMPDACDDTVNIASESGFELTERRNASRNGTYG